jgi:hypothetical protein
MKFDARFAVSANIWMLREIAVSEKVFISFVHLHSFYGFEKSEKLFKADVEENFSNSHFDLECLSRSFA